MCELNCNRQLDYKAAVVEGLLGKVESFHHGSCKGVDVQVARLVRKTCFGLVRIVSHPGPADDLCQEDSGVDDMVLDPKTHFARNRDIVSMVDEMIACPREMTEQDRGGTWYTIKHARKNGCKVTVVYPDGSIGS